MKTNNIFAARLVVWLNPYNNHYTVSFASEMRKWHGKEIADYGKWYGSQMSYQPFKRALASAEKMADELNAKRNQ